LATIAVACLLAASFVITGCGEDSVVAGPQFIDQQDVSADGSTVDSEVPADTGPTVVDGSTAPDLPTKDDAPVAADVAQDVVIAPDTVVPEDVTTAPDADDPADVPVDTAEPPDVLADAATKDIEADDTMQPDDATTDAGSVDSGAPDAAPDAAIDGGAPPDASPDGSGDATGPACPGALGCSCVDAADCSSGFCIDIDGKKACGACQPKDPAVETCDGVDNDCDGKTDEGGCDDANACTSEVCVKVPGKDGADDTWTCTFNVVAGACSDGSACTVADACKTGKCIPGAAPDCDDKNPCTDDSCEPKSGCVNNNSTAACDDGNACTDKDVCAAGKCSPGAALNCDDNNACTADSCDLANGCSNSAKEGACDDGSLCTVDDACKDGKCTPGAAKICAADDNPCTDAGCNADKGCVQLANKATCTDSNACTAGDLCVDTACAPGKAVDCDDGSPCTKDACDMAQGCTQTALEGGCDDGDNCTKGDVCAAGKCVPGAKIPCDDDDVCTTDSCDAKKGCVFALNTAPCDDGDPCTVKDACSNGKCAGGAKNKCEDGNPCTEGTCSSKDGCTQKPTIGFCDDGDACTDLDICKDGKCKSGDGPDCDDKDACTDDTCDPKTGKCVHTQNSGPCEDGDLCTTGDKCNAGKCITGTKKNCDDGNTCTSESCNSKVGCVVLQQLGECDDGNACTKGDSCSGGKCVAGGALNCDDGKVCSADACDPKTGCTYSHNTAPCEDGNKCTGPDKCDKGKCVTGAAIKCNDNNSCTVDACKNASGCAYTPKAGAGTPACDGTTWGGRCYRGYKVNHTWLQAEATCKQWGGHLASIASSKENAQVYALMGKTCGNNNGGWIGLTDAAKEGTWLWSDGTKYSYKNWNKGEPNNFLGNEDRVHMIGGGTWNDHNNSVKIGCYVCERALPLACNDASACTLADTCNKAGKCVGKALNCDDGNGCTVDSCDKKTGCKHVKAKEGSVCAGVGVCTKGACIVGTQAQPARTCADIKAANGKSKDGLYWLDPDGKGKGAKFRTWCTFGLAGGSWNLVAVGSDDGKNTWTWNNRTYWSTNTKTFGSLGALNKDFKSPGYHSLPMKDVLFYHQPSNVWASYNNVGNGKASLAAKVTSFGGLVCWQPHQGWNMSAGNLTTGSKLCSTKLYFNARDHDGKSSCGDNEHTYGPNWNARENNGCPFDDPGDSGGVGPVYNSGNSERRTQGYAKARGLNKGKANAAQNFLWIMVR